LENQTIDIGSWKPYEKAKTFPCTVVASNLFCVDSREPLPLLTLVQFRCSHYGTSFSMGI
jgi:hypothetical protein